MELSILPELTISTSFSLYLIEFLSLFFAIQYFKKIGLRLFLICLSCFIVLTTIDIAYALSGKIPSVYLLKGIIHLAIISFAVLLNFTLEKVKYKRRKFTYV